MSTPDNENNDTAISVAGSLISKGEPEAARTFLRIIKEVKPNPKAENGYLW